MKLSMTCIGALLTLVPLVNAQEEQTASNNADRAIIEKVTTTYVESYNQHDTSAVVALFSKNAELVERNGTRIVGTEQIKAAYETLFQDNPQAKISLSVDSLRFVTPDVAVEEGTTTWFPDGQTATVDSTYRVAHVKKNGRWRIAGARTIDDEILTTYEYLRDLEWMVGEWIDEGSDAVVESTCEWSSNRTFLIRKFSIKRSEETVLEGTQRIGWDAQNKQFRSWVFDSEGGVVDGYWTQVGDAWVIRSSGHLQDGTPVSGTSRIERDGQDRYVMSLFNRLRGDEIMPDVEVTIVRRPPLPVTTTN